MSRALRFGPPPADPSGPSFGTSTDNLRFAHFDDTVAGVSVSLLLETKPPGRPGGGNRIQVKELKVALCADLLEQWWGASGLSNMRAAVREAQLAGVKAVAGPKARSSMIVRPSLGAAVTGAGAPGGGAAEGRTPRKSGHQNANANGFANGHGNGNGQPSGQPGGAQQQAQAPHRRPGAGAMGVAGDASPSAAAASDRPRGMSIKAHILASHMGGAAPSPGAGGAGSPLSPHARRANANAANAAGGAAGSTRVPRYAPGAGVHVGAPHVGHGGGATAAAAAAANGSSSATSPSAAGNNTGGSGGSGSGGSSLSPISNRGGGERASSMSDRAMRITERLSAPRASVSDRGLRPGSLAEAGAGSPGPAASSRGRFASLDGGHRRGAAGAASSHAEVASNFTVNPVAPAPQIRTFVHRGALRARNGNAAVGRGGATAVERKQQHLPAIGGGPGRGAGASGPAAAVHSPTAAPHHHAGGAARFWGYERVSAPAAASSPAITTAAN